MKKPCEIASLRRLHEERLRDNDRTVRDRNDVWVGRLGFMAYQPLYVI